MTAHLILRRSTEVTEEASPMPSEEADQKAGAETDKQAADRAHDETGKRGAVLLAWCRIGLGNGSEPAGGVGGLHAALLAVVFPASRRDA